MTSDWIDCLLGDVVTLKRGYDLPKRERIPGAFPIISSSGVTGTHNVGKVKGPGVVTGRYGTLGEVFFVEEDFWPLNTSLYVRNFKGNSPRFISYFLQTLGFGTQNVAGAVPGVNRNFLHKLPVRKPPLPTQHKIASVLSAYDDLIENNTRRIAILEEMARALYREWFVNFRFPGHEKVKMVESSLGMIPEGCEVVKVKSVLKRLKAGHAYREKETTSAGAVPVIDQSQSDILGFHDNEPDQSASPSEPIAIFGDHTCKMRLMIEPFSVGPNVITFRAVGEHPLAFVFYLVADLVETREYKRHWTELTNKLVVLPPIARARQFTETIGAWLEHMRLLALKNQRLRTTRDLLLPKLISGEVDVSDLDIEIPEIEDPEVHPEAEPIAAEKPTRKYAKRARAS